MEQFFFQPENMPFLEIRTTLGSVMPYDTHFHTYFSIGLILDGQTRFFLDGQPHCAAKGDIVLIAPRQAHSCNPLNGQPRSYHMLFFAGAWFEEKLAVPCYDGLKIGAARPVITDPLLFSQGIRLIAAAQSCAAGSDVFSPWISSILSRAGIRPQSEERPKNGTTEAGMLILPDAHASYRITELAAQARMRRETYSRLIRRETGLPPQAWLHCLRIEKGRSLLRQGKTIAEAALETGYTDQSHFHRMFRRIVCATPGSYRKPRSHSSKT